MIDRLKSCKPKKCRGVNEYGWDKQDVAVKLPDQFRVTDQEHIFLKVDSYLRKFTLEALGVTEARWQQIAGNIEQKERHTLGQPIRLQFCRADGEEQDLDVGRAKSELGYIHTKAQQEERLQVLLRVFMNLSARKDTKFWNARVETRWTQARQQKDSYRCGIIAMRLLIQEMCGLPQDSTAVDFHTMQCKSLSKSMPTFSLMYG